MPNSNPDFPEPPAFTLAHRAVWRAMLELAAPGVLQPSDRVIMELLTRDIVLEIELPDCAELKATTCQVMAAMSPALPFEALAELRSAARRALH